ncbi:MAG: TIGR02281 family clan AA aspartic protease [Wolbachia endosymbiont of Fragariocoptes setiger]|nr:TIGR02281 family clan AA aspartic protease [Wolbachia endosymbiont of Fragariocoptes setiger]
MNALKDLIIWMMIIIATAMLFNSQGDKLNSNFFSTFLPHKGKIQGNGRIEFTQSLDGHFYIQAKVNNHNITFLLDTGATDIVLSEKDAIYAGINLHNIKNFKVYETGNGRIKAGVVQISQMIVGNFLIRNIQASVSPSAISHSLLGMSFLKYFDFTIKDNKLILYRDTA